MFAVTLIVRLLETLFVDQCLLDPQIHKNTRPYHLPNLFANLENIQMMSQLLVFRHRSFCHYRFL